MSLPIKIAQLNILPTTVRIKTRTQTHTHAHTGCFEDMPQTATHNVSFYCRTFLTNFPPSPSLSYVHVYSSGGLLQLSTSLTRDITKAFINPSSIAKCIILVANNFNYLHFSSNLALLRIKHLHNILRRTLTITG